VEHTFQIKHFYIKNLMTIYLKNKPTYLIKIFNEKKAIYTYSKEEATFLENNM